MDWFKTAVSHRDILHFPVPSREFKSLGHSRSKLKTKKPPRFRYVGPVV